MSPPTSCSREESRGCDEICARWHTCVHSENLGTKVCWQLTKIQILSRGRMLTPRWAASRAGGRRSWRRSCWGSWGCRAHRRSGRASCGHTCQPGARWSRRGDRRRCNLAQEVSYITTRRNNFGSCILKLGVNFKSTERVKRWLRLNHCCSA